MECNVLTEQKINIKFLVKQDSWEEWETRRARRHE